MSPWLPLEVVIFGTALVWLSALFPALAATLAKGQWRLFGWGLLTAGATWFAGALSLAPPRSAWARRFYGPELLERANRPLRKQRKPLTFAWWSAGAIALILLIGLFAARPAPILGVDGESIGNSLPDRGGGAFFSLWPPLGPCRQVDGDLWICDVYDDEGSGGTVDYRVKVGDRGCWRATPTGPRGRGPLSGCLTLLNYLE